MKNPSDTSAVKSTLHPLERRILTRLLKAGLKGERWVLALSGGLDSAVLGRVMSRIARFGKWDIVVATIHHGPSVDAAQAVFRTTACAQVESWATSWGFPVISRVAENDLSSEAAARKFRHQQLKEIATEMKAARIVMAHHRDDLLETRLIRLIRGTGPAGLPAMKMQTGMLLRPFLSESRAELMSYARFMNLDWVEDPSNQRSQFLRNWIRNDWLTALETARPGSTLRLSESLDLLVHSVEAQGQGGGLTPAGKVKLDLKKEERTAQWSRRAFLNLSDFEKGELLAVVFRKLQAPRMSQGRIGEVRKRIDSTRHHLEFHVGGLEFDLNQDQVVCRRI
ncbi:MAG: tRNA lysidine(34) synthetase TilS [Bdellovibrionales bacterium]|nr:tRNA lysidine(34) synthetase TilS [Bdellovibrionales bacterium]